MNEKMTLEEFFALADRVACALNVLREARGEVPRAMQPTDDRPPRCKIPTCGRDALPYNDSLCLVHTPGRVVPIETGFRVSIQNAAPVTNKGAVQWTPEELARKEELRARQAATLPTDPVMDALEASDEA